jgi:hypothetical protein
MRPRIQRMTTAKIIVALAAGLLALSAPFAVASPAGEQQQDARVLVERHLGTSAQPGGRALPMYALPMYGWMANMVSAHRGHMPYAGTMSHYLRGANGGYPSMMGGAGMMGGYGIQATSSSRGWPAGAIVLVAVLGGLLLAGALAFALPKLRDHHAGTPAARRT